MNDFNVYAGSALLMTICLTMVQNYNNVGGKVFTPTLKVMIVVPPPWPCDCDAGN